MFKTLRVISLSMVVGLLVSACSSVEKNSNTPEGAFAIAQEYDNGERYEEALRRYTDIKNKFPYSNYATKSELAMADVYYKQESYAEAQVSYQMFKDLHPTHSQIDYVQFRIGMSYFNQLPSTVDRDLTLANDAILNLTDLIKKFPNSEYVPEAKEKRTAAIKMLAEKEEYIADFYFKRKIYGSALGRYEGLYKNYGGLGFESKALSRAAISAAKIGDAPKAKQLADILFSKYPNTPEANAVKKELK
ncbi:Outer membrane protein assembly factor BamD precursor [compost metagenome]